MSKSVIKAARREYDVRSALSRDLSFSTEFFLPKIYRIMRSTTEKSSAHGLDYKPMVFFMREITSSPKRVGHYSWVSNYPIISNPSVTDVDVVFKKGKSVPPWDGNYNPPVTDAATIAVLCIDPLQRPIDAFNRKADYPVIRVGSEIGDPNKVLDSKYDTLKVFKSGEVTIDIPKWTSTKDSDVDTVTYTIDHNLGYIPFFAPFVPSWTSLTEYYGWLTQWHNRSSWSSGIEYIPKDHLQEPSNSGNFYECIKRHTSSTSNRPGSGVSWQTYWKLLTDDLFLDPVPEVLDLNELEDIKIVYGGVMSPKEEIVRLYVTTTKLVVEYERYALQMYVPGPITLPKRTIKLSYTIFYNRIDEEFNLLTT